MANEIFLRLNDASRDVALIHILLNVRINQNLLKKLCIERFSFSSSEMNEKCVEIMKEELAWIYRTLGKYGELDVEALSQSLDL